MKTARGLDLPVIGHAVRSVGIEAALETGQHIAHMEEFIYGYFQPAQKFEGPSDDLAELRRDPPRRPPPQ